MELLSKARPAGLKSVAASRSSRRLVWFFCSGAARVSDLFRRSAYPRTRGGFGRRRSFSRVKTSEAASRCFCAMG